ncbi:MAG: UbiD family decarboxylase [Chloroflexota bacterium]
MFRDLREFIDRVQELGEYQLVEDADAHLEIGALTHLIAELPDSPLLMFDKIRGYEPGYRVVSNLFTTPRRTALALGFPLEARGIELVRLFRDKVNQGIELTPPVVVESGPVMENIQRDADVDLLRFPTPQWHELDGGPYIGTGNMVVIRDPEEGWLNVACYRVQVHDRHTATIHATPAHALDVVQKKYWRKGLGCPAAVTCGQDPIAWLASIWSAPWGVCEYDIAGWWNGRPLEVVAGITTGLPVPATSEIVLEGEIVPPEVETRPEGPFGEWSGYYATGRVPRAAFRVKSVMHRDNPIIQGNPPSRFPAVWTLGRHIQRAAIVWSELDRQIPGVRGVWVVEEVTANSMIVISLKQEYPGHAKQAAMIAAGTQIASRYLHYLIVVDEDIDPSNISQVLWALGTRGDPEQSINIITQQVSAMLDPTIPIERRERHDSTCSLAIILAVKPYHWKDEFPPAITVSPELTQKVKARWGELFPK